MSKKLLRRMMAPRPSGKKIPGWLPLLVLLLSVFLLYFIYLKMDYLFNPHGSHPQEESQFESGGLIELPGGGCPGCSE